LVYRYASPKRLAWRGSVVAATTATLGFELAKRLYGLYLARSTGGAVYSIDAGITAVLLFLLWVWWVALVFLIGAAAAMVWESGRQPKIPAKA
jgi:membrane protein